MKHSQNEILLQDLAAEHVYTQVNGRRLHCVVAGEGRPVFRRSPSIRRASATLTSPLAATTPAASVRRCTR